MSLGSVTELTSLCRLCLSDSSEMIRYQLDSDFSILVMESGASVTIADALKYLNLDVKIPAQLEVEKDPEDEEEQEEKPATEAADDDPALPQSLCQVCLESIQSSYEFKFRCEENRNFLKSYLKEMSDSKLAEERAVKEAALAALDLDLDNLDNLPDKLVLKTIIKEKKPRKQRDPAKPPVIRKRKIQERNIIIAEDSQVESTAYIRKVNTPEQSPDQPRGNKRKSKHVVIEDIFVGANSGRKAEVKKEKTAKENATESPIATVDEPASKKAKTEPKKSIQDEEPIFEEDDDEEDLKPKRSTRKK